MRRLCDRLKTLVSVSLKAMTLICLLMGLPVQAHEQIRLGIQLEPPTLDPTITAAASAGEITWCNIFEGLTMVDGQGRIRPRLAREWQLSDDGLTYTFTLHKGVTFHDGSRFNAQTAAYALNRLLDADNANPQR